MGGGRQSARAKGGREGGVRSAGAEEGDVARDGVMMGSETLAGASSRACCSGELTSSDESCYVPIYTHVVCYSATTEVGHTQMKRVYV